MLSKVKRKIKRMLSRNKAVQLNGTAAIEYGDFTDKAVVFEEDRIIIQKDSLGESIPFINELAGIDENLIPRRKITALQWNGPILEIKGYYYLEGISLLEDDLVKKRLVLLNNTSGIKITIPLKDKAIDEMGLVEIEDKYYWAGFHGKINFATLDENAPIPHGEYRVYIELEVHVLGDKHYRKSFPLGNIEGFLNNGFHSAKMEYFTAKKEMKFNLLATYDLPRKTLKITSSKLKDMDPSESGLDAVENKRSIFYKFFSKAVFNTLYRLFCLLPLNEKKILFASDSRTEMSGNFKFVYDELVSHDSNYEIHFMLKQGVEEKKTYKEMVELAYLIATSKFILLDDFYPMVYSLKIRDGAELVQLWHAVGAFKTFGFSRLGRPGGPSPKSRNHRNYTKAIVSSKNVAKHYAEGFGIEKEKVIATGIPRTDIFFDKEYQLSVRENLYAEYPFLKGKKVIMFAPTFRGNGQQSAHYPMEVLDLAKLYEELHEEYVFLFKIHPFVKNDFSIPYQYSDFYYDFSSYREINDLLFITDILITDYSSVCFEFALLNKPMLFFAFDVEEYVRTRDFYYDFHSFIPGPLVRSAEEIIGKIQRRDFKLEKIDPFVRYFFDEADGKSSKRVVDQIILGKSNLR
ncbi:CDP-glycerol glycerophosphotransferase family protein [Mesobacillus subterraneus]|uniref:Polyribitolphosphotransferase n=1 Tax=Mesobacillus subterraneus TaxID=285983 RepID=A0A427TRS0_9BACI|nr:CDP-glycerol glycerophosphotransferase family protein [Mesobacillus subterraneus]RSD26973.1 polyribitolphosphotransferase [Mesobacillus subterraneus]